MVAYDDGRNTDYSDFGSGGFPLLHAGPLHRAGSAKGGPYTTACHAYRFKANHQFGSMKIIDRGTDGADTMCVEFKGHRQGGQILLKEKLCGPMLRITEGDVVNDSIECSLPLLPVTDSILLVGLIVTFLLKLSLVAHLHFRANQRHRCTAWIIMAVSLSFIALHAIIFGISVKSQRPFDDPFKIMVFVFLLELLLLGFLLHTAAQNAEENRLARK